MESVLARLRDLQPRRSPYSAAGYDLDERDLAILNLVRRRTMLDVARIMVIVDAVRHVADQSIGGAFVECGTWRGGAAMAAMAAMIDAADSDREVWLYDTFSGMTSPSENDIEFKSGRLAAEILAESHPDSHPHARAGLEDVKMGLELTRYPMEKIHLIKGNVLETLPALAPPEISVLHLDTDWYDSTKHELLTLYPRVVSGGIVIVDDYGAWAGAKKAVDEFVERLSPRPFLTRVDESRVFLVP